MRRWCSHGMLPLTAGSARNWPGGNAKKRRDLPLSQPEKGTFHEEAHRHPGRCGIVPLRHLRPLVHGPRRGAGPVPHGSRGPAAPAAAADEAPGRAEGPDAAGAAAVCRQRCVPGGPFHRLLLLYLSHKHCGLHGAGEYGGLLRFSPGPCDPGAAGPASGLAGHRSDLRRELRHRLFGRRRRQQRPFGGWPRPAGGGGGLWLYPAGQPLPPDGQRHGLRLPGLQHSFPVPAGLPAPPGYAPHGLWGGQRSHRLWDGPLLHPAGPQRPGLGAEVPASFLRLCREVFGAGLRFADGSRHLRGGPRGLRPAGRPRGGGRRAALLGQHGGRRRRKNRTAHKKRPAVESPRRVVSHFTRPIRR